ncbi:MAG TPA: hypothetical protein VHQ65_11920 [Thermoanaerobaculia bacterium]|nr:hypothetical protein [Thermoanaerobaculia bacterium]
MKTALILIVLVLLACLAVIGSRPAEPIVASVSEASRGPSFEVHVVFPRLNRPFLGLLPEPLVARLGGVPPKLGFDHASRGAEIGSVGSDRLELGADGWDLSLETDGEGRIAPETHLEFPLVLSSEEWRLRCRPGSSPAGARWRWPPRTASADPATGYLRTTTRAGGDELGGRFLFELATCEDADSGEAIDWLSAPLTVSGSFEGLPPTASDR